MSLSSTNKPQPQLVADIDQTDIKLYANRVRNGMLSDLYLTNGITERFFLWENVNQTGKLPQLALTNLSGQSQDVVVILTKGTGSNVDLQEVHILDANSLKEYQVEDPIQLVLKHVDTNVTQDKVFIRLPKRHLTLVEGISTIPKNHLFNQVAFGSILRFEVKNGKLYAYIWGQITPAHFVGYIKIEYVYRHKMFVMANMDFITLK